MSREIKFRAWAQTIVGGKQEMLDWNTYSEEITRYLKYPLLGVPVMQFTGLKDKNGKEIYEGDIVRCSNGSEGVSVWNNRIGMYRFDTNQTQKGFSHPTEGFDADTLEIVGNIYENPELLS